MKPKLSDEVLAALELAKPISGWNFRSPGVRRFELAGDFGRGCTLYVVPYRRFAYHRQESPTAQFWRAQGKPEGSAA